MTKAEIVQYVCDRVGGFSKKEVAALVDSIFETIKENLANGKKVKLSRFGNFVVRYKEARKGRNPFTLETITLPKRHVVRFRPSAILKQLMNEESERNAQHEPLAANAGR